MQEMWARSLDNDDPLEKEITTHSSILAWKSHGQRSHGVAKESDTTERLNNKFLSPIQLHAESVSEDCESNAGGPQGEMLPCEHRSWEGVT